jgi:hypothetical protein
MAMALRGFELQELSRWAHVLTLAPAAAWCCPAFRNRLPPSVATAGVLASAIMLVDVYGCLALGVSILALRLIWPAVLRTPAAWRPLAAGLLWFSTAWLLFFAIGNEFSLSAIHSLRRAMMGSDLGTMGGFSLPWTVVLAATKLLLLALVPLVTLTETMQSSRLELDWARALLCRVTLDVSTLAAAFSGLFTAGFWRRSPAHGWSLRSSGASAPRPRLAVCFTPRPW